MAKFKKLFEVYASGKPVLYISSEFSQFATTTGLLLMSNKNMMISTMASAENRDLVEEFLDHIISLPLYIEYRPESILNTIKTVCNLEEEKPIVIMDKDLYKLNKGEYLKARSFIRKHKLEAYFVK